MIANKPPIAALARAIQICGSVRELAQRLDVPVSLPSMWRARGRIPAEHCPKIEQATGGAVRCEELRPDVQWSVLRQKDAACREPRDAHAA